MIPVLSLFLILFLFSVSISVSLSPSLSPYAWIDEGVTLVRVVTVAKCGPSMEPSILSVSTPLRLSICH